MLTSKIRFMAQNWSPDQAADVKALKAATAVLADVPEGRVVSANPGSLLLEASAPKKDDIDRFKRRLEQALPGWSIYPSTSYRLS